MTKTFDELLPELQPLLADLENLRQRSHLRWRLGWMIVAAVFAATIGGLVYLVSVNPNLQKEKNATVLFFAAPLLVAGGVWLFLVKRPKSQFVAQASEKMLTSVASPFVTDLEYAAIGKLDKSWFENGRFCSQGFDGYESDGRLLANLGDIRVRWGEVHATRSEHDNQAKDKTKKVPVFNGLVVAFDFPGYVDGGTFIGPKQHKKGVGAMAKAREKLETIEGEQVIAVNDPEFDAAFTVTTFDKEDTARLLQPPILRAMLHVAKAFGTTVRFSCFHTYLIIGAELPGKLVSPAFKPVPRWQDDMRRLHGYCAACFQLALETDTLIKLREAEEEVNEDSDDEKSDTDD